LWLFPFGQPVERFATLDQGKRRGGGLVGGGVDGGWPLAVLPVDE
jgi:hypothetical protein